MRSATSKAKPTVRIEVLDNGKIVIGNICAAARWAGVSAQTFADMLRRHIRNRMAGKSTAESPRERILATYPELFA